MSASTKRLRQIKRVWNYYFGLPLKRFLYFSRIGRCWFVDEQNRVKIRKMEIYVANGCNLNCLFCSHLNPFRKGLVSKDELISSMEIWCRKVTPKKLGLLGGEPLLHPNLDEIISAARRCWPDSEIILTSNGLLFPKKSDELLQELAESRVHVLLSRHLTGSEGEKQFDAILKRLSDAGVWVTVIPSSSRWKRYYNMDEHGRPQPFESRPEQAWTMCGPNTCFNLTNNHLYRCSILANAALAFQEGVLGENWRVTQTYEPLSESATTDEIVSHLHLFAGPLPACSICPETTVVVEAEQIERLKNLQKKE